MFLCKISYFGSLFRRFKYRIYPSDTQKVLIDKHIGSCRLIYNLALETKQMAWAGNRVNLTCFDLMKQLKDLKNEFIWLKEINSQSLQKAIANLDTAFNRFFKASSKFPSFKRKSASGRFTVPQNISILGNRVCFPKFKEGINIVLHRPLIGKIKQATIIKSSTNKYFISILLETGLLNKTKHKITTETTIGIDLGVINLVTTSNDVKISNPKHLKRSLKKLKYLNSRASRFRGKRTIKRLAVAHEAVANKRKDFLHKLSNGLIRDNQSIAIESLKVSNMIKNHNLAQSIIDAGWGMFIDMLEYKAEAQGVNILKIGTFEPSSKTCSCCGNIRKDLTLRDRVFSCSCGLVLDRDVNAAINIKNFALKNHLSVGRRLKNRGELPTLVGVMTPETKNPL